ALAHEDRVPAARREHLHAGADARDPRRADEDGRDAVGLERRLERVHLAPVGVPLDLDVEEAPRRLPRVRHALREQDRARARPEVPLEREDARPHRVPRAWNRPSGPIFPISRPGIASPRPAEASTSAFGSSKFATARTIALARAAGSDDLKMPEPTNTLSAPN